MSAVLQAQQTGLLVRDGSARFYVDGDSRKWHSISTVCRSLTDSDMAFATAQDIRKALSECPPDKEAGYDHWLAQTGRADSSEALLDYAYQTDWPKRAMMRRRQGYFDRGNLVDELIGGLATGELGHVSDAIALMEWISGKFEARKHEAQASYSEFLESPESEREAAKAVWPYPFSEQDIFDWCYPLVGWWAESGWQDCKAQVQVRHEVKLSRRPIRLAGTLDIIGRDPQGRLRVMEVKSKAGGGPPSAAYTAQGAAYHHAAEAMGFELNAPPMFLVSSAEGAQTYDMTRDHLTAGWNLFSAALLANDERDALPRYARARKHK